MDDTSHKGGSASGITLEILSSPITLHFSIFIATVVHYLYCTYFLFLLFFFITKPEIGTLLLCTLVPFMLEEEKIAFSGKGKIFKKGPS